MIEKGFIVNINQWAKLKVSSIPDFDKLGLESKNMLLEFIIEANQQGFDTGKQAAQLNLEMEKRKQLSVNL